LSNPLHQASRELSRFGDAERQLAMLDALEAKRRDDCFIRYWEPIPPNEKGEQRQLEGLRAITEDAKTIIFSGGNRSGKTEAGAAVAVAWALGRDFFKGERAEETLGQLPIPEPPNNIWIIGLDFNLIRDVIWREKLVNGQEHPPLVPKSSSIVKKVSEHEFQILFTNGSVITCKSADAGAQKLSSAAVDLIWIDEECEAAVYDEAYQRTISTGGKILVTVTPLIDITSGVREPWLYNLHVRSQTQPDIRFVYFSIFDNPFVPAIEKERVKVKWAGHPEEEARLYGKFVRRAGLVYYNWDATKHIVQPFRISSDWYRLACIDPAPTGPTACLWCAADPLGNLFFYREYKEANLVVSEHAKNIRVRNQGDAIDLWLIDPKAGAARNAETHRTTMQLYRDAGIPCRLAEVDSDYGLEAFREYLTATVTPMAKHGKAYVFANLPLLRHEIETYTWDMFGRGAMRGMSKEKPKKGNDDLINCGQYISSYRPRARMNKPFFQNEEDRARQIRNNSY